MGVAAVPDVDEEGAMASGHLCPHKHHPLNHFNLPLVMLVCLVVLCCCVVGCWVVYVLFFFVLALHAVSAWRMRNAGAYFCTHPAPYSNPMRFSSPSPLFARELFLLRAEDGCAALALASRRRRRALRVRRGDGVAPSRSSATPLRRRRRRRRGAGFGELLGDGDVTALEASATPPIPALE
jgi:hypothetical protein